MFAYFLKAELAFTLLVALGSAIALWLVGIYVSSDTVENSEESETMLKKGILEGCLR